MDYGISGDDNYDVSVWSASSSPLVSVSDFEKTKPKNILISPPGMERNYLEIITPKMASLLWMRQIKIS